MSTESNDRLLTVREVLEAVNRYPTEFNKAKNIRTIQSTQDITRLLVAQDAKTALALRPFIEWVARLPCTLVNCTQGKHHPSCVPGQARKLVKEVTE